MEKYMEKRQLIKPGKKLINWELKLRTGLPEHTIKINKIDFLRDVKSITTIYYYD